MRWILLAAVALGGCVEDGHDPCCECLTNTTELLTGDPCIPISVDTCEENGPGSAQCYCWSRCADYCGVPDGCRD